MARRKRTLPLLALITTASVALCGCAVSNALSRSGSGGSDGSGSVSLRSADGSDVFSAPENVNFTLTDLSLPQSSLKKNLSLDASKMKATGNLTLSDGMITKLHVQSVDESIARFSFTLNSPIVLRPEGDPGKNLEAHGSVQVGDYHDDDYTLWVTPSIEQDDEEHLNLETQFDLPAQLPINTSRSSNRVSLELHFTETDRETN
jgi:hypothetical protein